MLKCRKQGILKIFQVGVIMEFKLKRFEKVLEVTKIANIKNIQTNTLSTIETIFFALEFCIVNVLLVIFA